MSDVLFFDLDGTLSDTHNLARASWLEVLRPHGIDVDFRFYQDHIRGQSNDVVINTLLPFLDTEQNRQLRESQTKSYRNRVRRAAALPGLRDFLDAARQRSYRLALVTNAPRSSSFESLHPLGLGDTFETMVFAEEVGAGKPDAAPYRAALQLLDVAADRAIAFEDSPEGVTAATGAGISVIALATTHHPADLRAAGAALVVGDFADPVLSDVLEQPDMLRDTHIDGTKRQP